MFEIDYEHVPDVDAYLERIGYTGTKEPTLENLHKLVRCHQMTVPFEALNLSLYGVPVSLKVEDLFRKVVTERRGGYCFELNGLFVALLRDLGYDAWSVMCRVARPGMTQLGGVMHRGNIINFEGEQYFCDVGLGFAMSAFAVKLSPEKQERDGETYWVEDLGMGWKLLKRKRGVGYNETGEGDYEEAPVTIFGVQPFLADDFATLNAATSSPDSWFSKMPQCNLRTPEGYKAIRGTMDGSIEYIRMVNGVKSVTTFPKEELNDVLARDFGVYPPPKAD